VIGWNYLGWSCHREICRSSYVGEEEPREKREVCDIERRISDGYEFACLIFYDMKQGVVVDYPDKNESHVHTFAFGAGTRPDSSFLAFS
jgi:hypothetical protein